MTSATVNKPVDPKQKEQDIDEKLQFFGMYHGFKNGKLPSNEQCDVAMNSALTSKALSSPSKDLSEEGQTLVKDVRNVVEQAKKMMLSKNDGQLIQEFIWGAQNFTAGDAKKPDAPISKDDAKQDANKLGENLKSLGSLMITNGEFRKLLSDFVTLARDIASDASQGAANKLRPSDEALAEMDQPAEENVWLDKPNTDSIKARARNAVGRNKSQQSEAGSDTASAAKGSVSTKTSTDTKAKAKEMAEKTKNYMQEKMPKERREQAIWRLKKMILEIQGHPDYQQGIETLFSLAEKYAKASKEAGQQTADAAKGVKSTDNAGSMEHNLRLLIERFANSTSLDDVFGSLEKIYHDADEDPELRTWFREMNTFIRRCLREQGYVMTEDCTHGWNGLYDRGVFLLRHRYKADSNRVLDEVKFFGEQFNKDTHNKAFGDAMQKLFLDLGRDENGKPKFKKDLVKDIRDVILPAVFEHVRYVPVPRLEVSDPMIDVVVENLVIESDNLMPNVVEFGSDNYFRWGRKKITNKRDNKIMISVSGIQADLKDVSYYIKKKQGFPSIKDKGVMDIFLGGEGFGFKIAASTAQNEDRQHFVKLDKVDVNIHHMDIKLKKSKHRALFAIFKPMLFNVVRPAMEKVVEKQIRDAFMRGDEFAFDVHSEAKKAQESAKRDPENQRNAYAVYFDAIKSQMQKKKEESQKGPKRDTKIQTSTTLHDSLFPNIELPGALSSKATAIADRAKEGDRWKSDIFSIGIASQSSDIPKPNPITRKPHNVHEGGRVEPDGIGAGASQSGATNGATNGYSSRGFADEVSTAIDGKDADAAKKTDGKITPDVGSNPQTA